MTEEAKLAKAEAILDKAQEIFLSTEYDKIKMADIAKAMGMSNGILYVYFKTKETLFMCLLWREYVRRLDYLTELAQQTNIKSFADIREMFLTELEMLVDTNPLYIKLESMRAAIFEKNADLEVMFNMKKMLYERTLEWTAIISETGVLTQEQLIDIFFMEAAAITGCKLGADLPPAVLEIIDKLGLANFQRNFKEDVMDAVGCLLDGFEQRNLHKEN